MHGLTLPEPHTKMYVHMYTPYSSYLCKYSCGDEVFIHYDVKIKYWVSVGGGLNPEPVLVKDNTNPFGFLTLAWASPLEAWLALCLVNSCFSRFYIGVCMAPSPWCLRAWCMQMYVIRINQRFPCAFLGKSQLDWGLKGLWAVAWQRWWEVKDLNVGPGLR